MENIDLLATAWLGQRGSTILKPDACHGLHHPKPTMVGKLPTESALRELHVSILPKNIRSCSRDALNERCDIGEVRLLVGE